MNFERVQMYYMLFWTFQVIRILSWEYRKSKVLQIFIRALLRYFTRECRQIHMTMLREGVSMNALTYLCIELWIYRGIDLLNVV